MKTIIVGLMLISSVAYAAKGKKAPKKESVTILDMSGPVESSSALPEITKKGSL